MINPLILSRKSRISKKYLDSVNVVNIPEMIQSYKQFCHQFERLCVEIRKDITEQIQEEKHIDWVNLQRDIYNDRIHRVEKYLHHFKNSWIYPKLYQLVDVFNKKNSLYEELLSSYDRLKMENRKMLQNVFRIDDLRNPLLLFNRNIYHRFTKYMEEDIHQHKNKIRKLDDTLMKIYSRSAMKTSPFSTLTKVGVAQVDLKDESRNDERDSIHIKLNRAMILKGIYALLSKTTSFLKEVHFILPPHQIYQKEGTPFISYVAQLDQKDAYKVFRTREVLYDYKLPKGLASILEDIKPFGEFRYPTIVEAVENEYGRLKEEDRLKIVQKYVELGLFIPKFGFDSTKQPFLPYVLEQIKPYLTEATHTRLKGIFNTISTLLNDYEQERDFHKRFVMINEIDQCLDEFIQFTNINFDKKVGIYEDGIIDAPLRISSDQLSDIEDSLKKIQMFSLLFDVNTRLQLELGERIYRRIGSRKQLIDSDLFKEIFNVSKDLMVYWSSPEAVNPDVCSPTVKMLDDLKLSFIREINELDFTQDELNLAPLMEKYLERIPFSLVEDSDLSSTFFVQFTEHGAVLNGVYDGQQKFKARFLDYFQNQTQSEEYQNYLKNYFIEQNYYELLEDFGFNGNIHQPLLNRECMSKGTGTRRFIDQTPLDSIIFENNYYTVTEESHRIQFQDHEGQPINLVMMGSLVSTAIPGYYAFLTQLFSSGRLLFKFGDLIGHGQIPRIAHGSLVLSRKRFRLSEHVNVFKRFDGESDQEYFVRINFYFHDHSLPSQFFITYRRNQETVEKTTHSFKPLYVDVHNPILLRIWEKELKKLDYLDNFYIEECLSNEGEFVEEFDIELSKLRGEMYEFKHHHNQSQQLYDLSKR